MDGLLATPGFFGDGSSDAVRQALAERVKLARGIEERETEWLTLQGQLDAVEKAVIPKWESFWYIVTKA